MPSDIQRGIAMLEGNSLCSHFLWNLQLPIVLPKGGCFDPYDWFDLSKVFCFVFAALVVNDTSAMKLREKLYLLALGYYRSGDFSRSRDCIERCLEV